MRSLETTFSEYRQTNLFVDAVSAIPGIVHQYMTQQMTEAVREAVQIQTDQLQDSFQRENDEFLCNIDENIKKIIKGQVKSQVKEQVLRILPRIKESVNATLEAEVLTRSSHSSRTSYAIAADLSELELKKILIEKMEGNKSIQTRLTLASLEMRMCLKDHLDAQERKQDKSTLETPVDFEEEILNAEVQENEAIPLSDKEIALDAASSEGSMSGPGSGGEEAEANYGYDVYHDDY
nr:hypothetical protein [Tanacetum cinerariifolium]